MRKVLIGTPCFDGRVDCWYAHSLVQTIKLCAGHLDITPVFMSYDSLVQRARNDLVKIAMETECDDILFIDADQGWEPAWILALLQYPVDCVGFAVRKKTDEFEDYNVKSSVFPIPVDPTTGLWNVESLGTGFLRLSRKAFTALWNRSEEYSQDNGQVGRWIFDVKPAGGRLVGEDVAMCYKLRQAGINVYLDPSCNPSHTGIKTWTGDFESWVSRHARERAEQPPTMNSPSTHLRAVQ